MQSYYTMRTKIFARFCRLVLVYIAAATLPPTAAWEMSILHMNDHHSHIDQETFDLEGTAVPPGLSVTTSDIRVTYGGFPRLVTSPPILPATSGFFCRASTLKDPIQRL